MRTQLADRVRALGRRRVDLHWTHLFGVVTLACLLVLAVTGILLAVPYAPSSDLVTYAGPYTPLVGTQVSEAFASTMAISLEQPGGLLLRQTHHWAALVLPAAMIVQILATFFTGGFRRPRRLSWVLLIALFLVVLAGGWSGYALPDDMLSGTGLRIVEGVVMAIPVVGTRLVALLFGGRFPGEIIEHLYPVHLFVVPGIVAVLMVARAGLAYRHGAARLPRAGLSTASQRGLRLWPDVAVRAAGMTAITSAVLIVLGATATVSPIWSYGPTAAGNVGAGSQPDWYTGFLDGALRLVPAGWETEWFGFTWTFAILVPLAVIGGYFLVVFAYPFLESWVVGDTADQQVLDRPRNVPARTGIGVAGALFYGVLWGAASADVVATRFGLSFESIITTLQVVLLLGPPVAYELTRRICIGLQRRDREVAAHGRETGRIVRLADGGYVEVHAPVRADERAALLTEAVAARPARLDASGRLPRRERLRQSLSRGFAQGHARPAEAPDPGDALEPARPEHARAEVGPVR